MNSSQKDCKLSKNLQVFSRPSKLQKKSEKLLQFTIMEGAKEKEKDLSGMTKEKTAPDHLLQEIQNLKLHLQHHMEKEKAKVEAKALEEKALAMDFVNHVMKRG